ncbi:MAG: exo-alpha-sialidase [Planctomycetota bacterium]|nr:exo-alpha-sialidase [Planctomycetota bacterium]
MPSRVVVAVGTRKGLFVFEGGATSKKLELRGPFFHGMPINATFIDCRTKSPRVLAVPSSPWFGTTIQVSKDLGKKFKPTKSAPAFTADDGRTLKNVWSLGAGSHAKELLCGVEPAALFRSTDSGESWEKVSSISDHPHARTWMPGAGGLCLHTILHHGGALHLGISTGGHYASRDGMQTFEPENTGVGAAFQPVRNPEYGQCVHKIAAHPDKPERLYMMNHGGFEEDPTLGVLRSDDGGKSWTSIAKGLPSDFGFPIVVHPHDPDTVYVMPLAPNTRTCPDGNPAIWRSTSAGAKWEKLSKGLPKKDAYFTILRDGMDVDNGKKPSVWFGTTTGQLWRGREGGDEFECVASALPPIHCVKVAVVD